MILDNTEDEQSKLNAIIDMCDYLYGAKMHFVVGKDELEIRRIWPTGIYTSRYFPTFAEAIQILRPDMNELNKSIESCNRNLKRLEVAKDLIKNI